MAAGGHHAGFAAMVTDSLPRHENLAVEYVVHQTIDVEIRESLEKAGCSVHADFSINFYEYYDQPCKIPDIQPYLLQLTKEFRHAIESSIRPHEGEVVTFFYPTIGWEHAYCLALAMQSMTAIPSCAKHIVCAMVNPALDYLGRTTDQIKRLNNTLAFRWLSRFESVQIYASDSELATAYAKLLDQPQPLSIHPCYLVDWESIRSSMVTRKNTNAALNVILYLGDAKENKGFFFLPELTREFLVDKNLDVEINIQYTLPWSSELVIKTASELKQIAKQDPRLILYEGFMSDNALHDFLQQADLFIVNYDQKAYQDKNSGLLWLIGWYKTPVVFLGTSWLSREAVRLEIPILKKGDSWGKLMGRLKQIKQKNSEAEKNTSPYRLSIFQPFWNWIASR
jgi:hypothetical protein